MSKWGDIAATVEDTSKWKLAAEHLSEPEGTEVPAKEDLGWMDTLKKAVSNVPSSGALYAKNVYQMIRHPVQTAETTGKAAMNIAGPGIERLLDPNKEIDSVIPYPEADMISLLKQRYGNLDAFKETLANDPVGTMADISSVFYPASKAASGMGFARTATTLEKASQVTEPMNLLKAGGGIMRGAATSLIPKGVPSRLYESAVKLSTALPIEQRRRIVNTALEKQIMPTYNGLSKLNRGIDSLNTEISSMIDTAAAAGEKISLDRLFKGFDDLEQNILEVSGEPITGFNKFESVKDEIKQANEMIGRNELTVKEAQKMKQRIYRELEKEYNRVSLHPISAEARMAVARNLKEAIEEIIPEVKELNANESELIELRDAITRATERIRGRDLLSLGTTAKAAGGAAVAGGPGLATGLLLGLMDSQPIIKSKLGLVLSKIKSKGFKTKPTLLGAMLGLYQAGRLDNEKMDSKQFIENMANIGK